MREEISVSARNAVKEGSLGEGVLKWNGWTASSKNFQG